MARRTSVGLMFGECVVSLLSVAAALCCCIHVVSAQSQQPPYAVETLMQNMHYYGPTFSDGNWGPRPMSLIADYTWQINVTLEVNSFFLLVNLEPDGTPDWKSCKLGRGLDPTTLEIGGGNIPVPARGDYTLTYFTPSLGQSTRTPIYSNAKPSGFQMMVSNQWPAATLNATTFVVEQSPFTVELFFNADVDTSVVQANFSSIQLSNTAFTTSVNDLVVHSSRHVSLSISITSQLPQQSLLSITVPEGLARAINADSDRPNTGAEWSLIYAPPSTRHGVGSWERLVYLRDNGNRWPVAKPDGGWFVTGIHGNILPTTGQILVTGWGRSEEFSCTSAGARKQGVSFLIHPDEISNLPAPSSASPNITYYVNTIDEAPRSPVDVLYCSGHAPLRDGRKLYAGGAWYKNLSTPFEKETGIPYARMFDPLTGNFTRIEPDMPIGTAWYPTNSRMTDGRVIISGGFLAFTCYGSDVCTNPALTIFNVTAFDNGLNPFEWYLPANESNHDIDPGGKDYTRIWQLFRPIFAGGYTRTMAMMGFKGDTLLVNVDRDTPQASRFYIPPGGQRPRCNYDSSSTILSTGELLSFGGCGSSYIDLYNPYTDTWRSVDTGIPRNTPSTLLLPDGTVLIINGENGSLDQSAVAELGTTPTRDPRYPQIFDPLTLTVRTFPEREDGGFNNLAPFRGYHNMVSLLKDGRILVSGGVHFMGDIGCEQPTMRVYNPPYLNPSSGSKTRPSWDVNSMLAFNQTALADSNGSVQFLNSSIEPFFIRPNSTFMLSYANGPLLNRLPQGGEPSSGQGFGIGGVALMALQAFTHAYDQNQRYVAVEYADADSSTTAATQASGTIRLRTPDDIVLIPGEYLLFLLSANGVPSVALQVRALAVEETAETSYRYPSAASITPWVPSNPYVPSEGDPNDSGIWSTKNKILIAVLGGAGICFFCALGIWFASRMRKEGAAQEDPHVNADGSQTTMSQ